jgi:hypothetical protein
MATATGDVAFEFAGFVRLLNLMPAAVVQENREFFELAFEILQAEQPDLLVVKSIRRNLFEISDRYMGGMTRFVHSLSGKTLLNAVLSGLATILFMSFAFLLVMRGVVKLMVLVAGGAISDMRLLNLISGPSFNELLLMSHAAFLGSIVSIMSRIKIFLADLSLTPSMLYLSIVTRPVVSVQVAVLAFCALKSGMVSFQAVDIDGANGYYTAWLIGFLCGFSERLAQNFVASAVNSISNVNVRDSGETRGAR